MILLARLAGLEPAACGLEVRCSIQLSYRRTNTAQSLCNPKSYFFSDRQGRYHFIVMPV